MTETHPRAASRVAVRTRVVEAAARLLQEQGPAGVTTRAVAHAAATQAPTIYRLFGDKDGLLDAVAEHELARYVAGKTVAEQAVAGKTVAGKAGTPAPVGSTDPVADLRTAWDDHVRFGLAHPALFGYLADPDRGARSPAAAAGLEVLRGRVGRVAAAGRLRVAERRAVELIHAAGTGAVLTLLATPLERRDPQLARTLLEAVLGAVLTDAGPGGDAGGGAVATAAVTLRAATDGLSVLSTAERALLAEWLERVAAG